MRSQLGPAGPGAFRSVQSNEAAFFRLGGNATAFYMREEKQERTGIPSSNIGALPCAP